METCVSIERAKVFRFVFGFKMSARRRLEISDVMSGPGDAGGVSVPSRSAADSLWRISAQSPRYLVTM